MNEKAIVELKFHSNKLTPYQHPKVSCGRVTTPTHNLLT